MAVAGTIKDDIHIPPRTLTFQLDVGVVCTGMYSRAYPRTISCALARANHMPRLLWGAIASRAVSALTFAVPRVVSKLQPKKVFSRNRNYASAFVSIDNADFFRARGLGPAPLLKDQLPQAFA